MNPENQPDLSGQDPSGPGFGLDDAYYILFRRKWILLGFTVLGVAAAIAVSFLRPPRYESKAKLMVQYVVDTKVNPDGPEVISKIDSGADAIIKSEVEILMSLDVAADVVDMVGAQKILAKKGGGSDRMSAAGVVLSGIEVAPPRSAVITISFKHPDKEVVEPVLRALIDRYMIQHRKVHKRGGDEEVLLASEREKFQEKLTKTEEELKKYLVQLKGMAVDDAKKTYVAQIETLMSELLKTQADLAEAKALVGETSKPAATTSNANVSAVSIPADKMENYNLLNRRLSLLRQQEQNYLFDPHFNYTLQHPAVTNVQGQIRGIEEQKSTLEKEFPTLASMAPSLNYSVSTNLGGVDVALEIGRIKKYTARVETLSEQLSNMQAQATGVIALEPIISRLQREREQYDKEYQYYVSSLTQTRMEANGKGSNMSIVQHPTPPGLDMKKMLKLVGMAFGGCVGAGLALAFLLDFVIDRTVKRPVEVERHLHLPLLISIPDSRWNGKLRLPGRGGHRRSARRHAAHREASPSAANGLAVARWDSRHSIQLYANGLRERLITYFEGSGPTHGKPKRVAVTSCGHGAGVTTIATSLASALSRIPNVKVLLVDMNIGHGVARTFRNGEPASGGTTAQTEIPHEDEAGNSIPADEASMAENYAVVPMRNGENGESHKGLPTGLAHLAPQFEANDHDFIIFDLPPASPTSMTPRLAGYMDIVLLVLESEKTGRQTASHASELMKNSRANVAAVLNKYRKYVPERLAPEF